MTKKSKVFYLKMYRIRNTSTMSISKPMILRDIKRELRGYKLLPGEIIECSVDGTKTWNKIQELPEC